MTSANVIYHLLPQSEHLAQADKAHYTPASFAEEGFIHCSASEDVLLTIANAIYQSLSEPLLCYVIDPAQLTAPLRYEAAITPGHADSEPDGVNEILFPHLYGPLNREAILKTLTLHRIEGQWHLPNSPLASDPDSN